MRAKPEKRIIAEKLRKEQGLSYNEISTMTGVSKSTLSSWLRNISLTAEQEAHLKERLLTNRASFAARSWPINRERYKKAREVAYQTGAEVVSEIKTDIPVEELALAMLYLGEGTKVGNKVEMASTNPQIVRYFLWALLNIYQVKPEKVTLRIHISEAARPIESQIIDYWANELSYAPELFKKTQYDSRSRYRDISNDYRGVCTACYNDTYLQQHILGLAFKFIETRPYRIKQEE